MEQKTETWNLADVTKGKTIQEILEQATKDVEEFKKLRAKLDNLTPKDLLAAIQLKEKILIELQRVTLYQFLKFAENTSDTKILAEMNLAQQKKTEMSNDMMFLNLWFIDLSEEKANKFIESEELKEYKHYLESTRKLKPYTKSEEIEKIISIMSMTSGGAFADIYDVFTEAFLWDFDGKQGITREELKSYAHNRDPKLREEMFEALNKKYEEHTVVLSEIYKNIVMDWVNNGIKIRGYKSPITIRNINNDVEDKSVEALLKVVRKNSSILAEYFKIKRELNLKKGANYPLHRAHIYAPYEGESEKKYSYEKSKEVTLELFKEFHKEFHEGAKKIFDEKHIHSHPAKNKRGGAFSYGVTHVATPYILLNHTDTLNDMFTMAHEFGHSIHSILSGKLPYVVSDYSLPMGETASVFSEMLLSSKLLKESKDKEEKITVLLHMLDSQYATIVRQAYFVIFEKEAHEMIKNGATKEQLDEKWLELLKEQFGEMEVPDHFKYEWQTIPHIHHTPFYCYAYAWGNLMVLALYNMYQEEGEKFKDKYINLLSAGGSDTAENLLKPLGINPGDEAFWQKGMDIIKEEVEQLKEFLK